MSFLRRKSGVYHEDIYVGDPEPQPKHERRRLSKPQAASFSNPDSFSSQQYTGQSIIIRAEHDLPIGSIANDSRELVRSHLFSSTSPSTSTSEPESNKSKSRIMGMSAYMATTVSNDNSTQPSSSQTSLVSPTLPTLPISRMLSAKRASENRKPSISSLGSKDRYATDLDLGNVSPPSSNEQLASDPAPPARRPASFTPGMATRLPNTNTSQHVIHEESESTVSLAEAVIMRKTSVKDVPTVEHDRTWSPPSPPALNERSGTPANPDVTHIGRLGLGSLHIVNGRASPTPSDVSKTPGFNWVPPVKRETSSCYPESEIGTIKSRKTIHSEWEDEPVPSLAGSRPDVHRTFSFNPGAETSFNKTGRVPSFPLPGIDASILAIPEDRTREMAQQYISDLPTSPFSESPASSSPVLPLGEVNSHANEPEVAHKPELLPEREREREPGPEQGPEPQTPRNVPPMPSSASQAYEDLSSPVSMGSVRRYSDRANGRRSFIDETLEPSPVMDRAISPASFFSVPEPEEEPDLPFQSAVEIQPMTPRSRSPRKPSARSPIPAGRNSREGPRGPISDSGYSSNTSLGVILPPGELRTPTGNENNVEKDRKRGIRFPFQKMQKSGKPVIVKPTPSTKVPSPTSVRIESISALTSQTSFLPTESSIPNSTMSLPVSPLKAKEKRKKLVKLRRKSTAEAASELVVQRLASVDCLSVPPVSTVSKNNLAQRARAIPELDRTYRTQNHTARSANASMLSLATAAKELRFPSPQPEEEERDGRGKRSSSRSRSRGRSFSRPRSWINWSRKDKSGSRGNSKDRENNRGAELNDFGSVADLLGDNPYDIAQRSRSTMPPSSWNNRPVFFRRQTTPSNISTNNPRPRSAMDDQTASILSNLRRRSISERDARQSLDERRSGSWRPPPQDLHTPTDVPPLPAMPTAEEINRRFSYRHGYATHPRPLSYRSNPTSQRNSQIYDDGQQQWYEDGQQHSQPQYDGGQSQFENSQYGEPIYIDELHDAPPPPSHSPRPMYVEDENQQHYVQEPDHIYTQEEAPLPPRHSPMPQYVDHDSGYEQAVEDEAPAPPPPSHSPRPMDITPDTRPQQKRETSWSSPADAWNVRRQSAGEALRRSWGKVEQLYRAPQQLTPTAAEPTRQLSSSSVPKRKPVPTQWVAQENDQQRSYQPRPSGDFRQRPSGDFQRQDDGFQGRNPHQFAYNPDNIQYQPNNNYHNQEQHYDQYEQLHQDPYQGQPQHNQYQNRPGLDYPQQDRNDYSAYQRQQQQQPQQQYQIQRRPLPQQQQPDQYNYYHAYNNNQQQQRPQPQPKPQPQQYQQSPTHPFERQKTYPPPSLLNYRNHHSPSHARQISRPSSRHSQISNSNRSLTEDNRQDYYNSPTRQQQQQRHQSPHPNPSPQLRTGQYSPTRQQQQQRHQSPHPSPQRAGQYSPTRQYQHPQQPQPRQTPSPLPPSPQYGPGIGRYSGGLDLNYDLLPRPFDGSSTGSVSPVLRHMRTPRGSSGGMSGGRASDGDMAMMSGARKRHSWLDMESYGRDLDDVPGVPVVVGSVGGRMIYQ